MSETWPPPKPSSASKGSASYRKKDGGASNRDSHRASATPATGNGAAKDDGVSGWATKESPRDMATPPPVARSKSLGSKADGESKEGKEGKEKGKEGKSTSKKKKRDKLAEQAALEQGGDRHGGDQHLPTFLRHLLMHRAVGSTLAPVDTDAWATCDLSDGWVAVADALEEINTSAPLREVAIRAIDDPRVEKILSDTSFVRSAVSHAVAADDLKRFELSTDGTKIRLAPSARPAAQPLHPPPPPPVHVDPTSPALPMDSGESDSALAGATSAPPMPGVDASRSLADVGGWEGSTPSSPPSPPTCGVDPATALSAPSIVNAEFYGRSLGNGSLGAHAQLSKPHEGSAHEWFFPPLEPALTEDGTLQAPMTVETMPCRQAVIGWYAEHLNTIQRSGFTRMLRHHTLLAKDPLDFDVQSKLLSDRAAAAAAAAAATAVAAAAAVEGVSGGEVAASTDAAVAAAVRRASREEITSGHEIKPRAFDLFLWVDLQSAIEGGVIFYQAAGGGLVCDGLGGNGILPPEHFSMIIELKGGELLLDFVQVRPPAAPALAALMLCCYVQSLILHGTRPESRLMRSHRRRMQLTPKLTPPSSCGNLTYPLTRRSARTGVIHRRHTPASRRCA